MRGCAAPATQGVLVWVFTYCTSVSWGYGKNITPIPGACASWETVVGEARAAELNPLLDYKLLGRHVCNTWAKLLLLWIVMGHWGVLSGGNQTWECAGNHCLLQIFQVNTGRAAAGRLLTNSTWFGGFPCRVFAQWHGPWTIAWIYIHSSCDTLVSIRFMELLTAILNIENYTSGCLNSSLCVQALR